MIVLSPSADQLFPADLVGFLLLFLTITYISPHCSRYSSFVLFGMAEVHLECLWTVIFLSHRRSTNWAFAEVVSRAPLISSDFFQRLFNSIWIIFPTCLFKNILLASTSHLSFVSSCSVQQDIFQKYCCE